MPEALADFFVVLVFEASLLLSESSRAAQSVWSSRDGNGSQKVGAPFDVVFFVHNALASAVKTRCSREAAVGSRIDTLCHFCPFVSQNLTLLT